MKKKQKGSGDMLDDQSFTYEDMGSANQITINATEKPDLSMEYHIKKGAFTNTRQAQLNGSEGQEQRDKH